MRGGGCDSFWARGRGAGMLWLGKESGVVDEDAEVYKRLVVRWVNTRYWDVIFLLLSVRFSHLV